MAEQERANGDTPDGVTSSGATEPTPDGATSSSNATQSSEEWLEEELSKAAHAARAKKAENYLIELVESGEKDSKWIEGMLEDLDEFVAENKGMLDKLLEGDSMDIDNGDKNKRSAEDLEHQLVASRTSNAKATAC